MRDYPLYSGCGNSFVLVDHRDGHFDSTQIATIQELCQEVDGLLLLEHSDQADIRMRIFNADGNEASMCGNGVRCIVRYLHEENPTKTTYQIETKERLLTTHIDGDTISVTMGQPTDLRWNHTMENQTFHHLNTGVPHLVTFVENLDDPKWMSLAPQIRHHPDFSPEGANVNFAQILDSHISIRTYERGLERETLACGTGATAVALAANKVYQLDGPIKIETRSSDFITIAFSPLRMIGPATKVMPKSTILI